MALNVNPGNGTTNTGTLEATGGGTLNLGGGHHQHAAGPSSPRGSGSTVNLAGAGASTITGGTLTTTGGGVMYIDGSTLSGVTISAGSTVSTSEQQYHHPDRHRHQQRHDRAQLRGNTTDMNLSGCAALTADRRRLDRRCPTTSNNRIYGSGTDTLTVNSGATIQGSGQIGIGTGGYAFALTNNGHHRRQPVRRALDSAPAPP